MANDPIFIFIALGTLTALWGCGGRADAFKIHDVLNDVQGQKCSLWTDSQGIPHVKSSTDLGAMACWGYLHGRDRAWQMDFFRRTAQGRKAEIFGANSIRGDFLIRAIGLAERARRLSADMPESEKKIFSAYSHGVNLGFKEAQKSGIYEIARLGGTIEPWRPEDSVALILLQSFDQTRKSYEQEMIEEARAARFGLDAAPRLFGRDDLPWDTSILKKGEYPDSAAAATTASATPNEGPRKFAGFAELGISTSGVGEGSNSWVVSPWRSKGGHAWLANDPHLGLKYPPFWHWSHVEGSNLDIVGASLPGVPIVTSGSNRKVAWGLTNSYLDVADLAHIPDADLKNVKTYRPIIWTKVPFLPFQLPTFFKTYSRTEQDWPILPIAEQPGKSTVLRWSGFDVAAGDFNGLFEAMHSSSVAQTDEAFSKVGVPTWNFVFADIFGKTGYRAIGKVPRRTVSPSYGVTTEPLADLAAWKFLTTEEMPHLQNPPRGFIATANNRQWPKGSTLSGGRAYADGFRAFRIEELLIATPKHDLASLRKTQCDVQAVDARFLLPELLKYMQPSVLTEWTTPDQPIQQFATTDSRTIPVYRRWVDLLMERTGYDETALYHALISDTAKDRSQLSIEIRRSHGEAVKQARGKTWGELHRISFSHLAGEVSFPSAESLASPGDAQSVNPGSMTWHDDHYEQTQGASQRLIVELTDPPTVYQILSGPDKDMDHKNLSDPNGPFMKWVNCQQERRVFPLDWSKLPQITEFSL